MMTVALTGHEVEIPAAATKLAERAEAAGWEVQICTAYDQARTGDLELAFEHRWEDKDRDAGGGRSRIPTDVPRMTATVSVRCRRDADYVFGVWADGKFDFAARPATLGLLSSTQLLEHLHRPLDVHRWIPRSRTVEVCPFHLHTRSRVA